ncbi:MAG: ATP-binding cassette domain-containing protein [Alkalispirochaeta sp.]
MAPLLTATGLRKRYGSVDALAGADLVLHRGEIHGLVGENGAGKSTLMRIIGGIEYPDEGSVRFPETGLHQGDEPVPSIPGDPTIATISAIVPQYPRMAGDVPVWQNVLIGAEPRMGPFLSRTRARRLIDETSRRYRIDLDTSKPASHLNGTELRLAALLAALLRKPQLLILDEPTVGLADGDRRAILRSLRDLRDGGIGVLFISHDLTEVSSIADRVTVIARGRTIAHYAAPMVPETLADVIFGERREHEHPPRTVSTKKSTGVSGVRFEDARIYDGRSDRSVGPLRMNAAGGRITAITGVRESGIDIIEGYLSGEARIIEGSVRIGESRLSSRIDPAQLRRSGLVYIPSDRFDVAAALDGSVEENAIVQMRSRAHPGGIKTQRHSSGITRALLGRFGVDASQTVPLGALSGGMIQKLILARELAHPTPGCVIAEPFSGLDLAGQDRLTEILRGIADLGSAVVVITSAVDSAVAVADEVFVLAGGVIDGPYEPTRVDEINRAFTGIRSSRGVPR